MMSRCRPTILLSPEVAQVVLSKWQLVREGTKRFLGPAVETTLSSTVPGKQTESAKNIRRTYDNHH